MTPTLSAARAAAAAARARHEADAAVVDRARAHAAETKAALEKLTAEDAAAISRDAKRREKFFRDGAGGSPPPLVPTEKHVAAQITTQRSHAAAVQTLANLEADERASRNAHMEAEEALQAAVLKAVSDEADVIAVDLEAARQRVHSLEALLGAVREVPNFQPSRAVYRALLDDINMPIAECGRGDDFDKSISELQTRPTPADAAAHWDKRIAQLRTGDGADPTEGSAAAA